MDFPAQPPRRVDPPAALARALGQTPTEVWVANYMAVVLADEAAVRAVKPDVHVLKDIVTDAISGRGNLGVVALAERGKPYDVVSRFFAPGSGIAEDPATGSWHCIIAPLMADRLGRQPLMYHQAYPGRGGDMECEVRGDRVLMRGQAVTVIESRLRL
jgi:predicted PhzF superfamily epimerase YddE/YHI9